MRRAWHVAGCLWFDVLCTVASTCVLHLACSFNDFPEFRHAGSRVLLAGIPIAQLTLATLAGQTQASLMGIDSRIGG
eukprot:12269332-Alexandrium_andersonii.AAC.1